MQFKVLKHKKWRVISLCGVLILSIAAGILLRPKVEEDGDIIWREYPVEHGDITASLDGSGKLEFTGAFHGFEVDLKIEEIFVEVGQEVKKGDKLVQYSREEIEKKVEEQQRSLDTAERALEDLKNTQQSGKLQSELANAQSQQAAQNAYDRAKRELDASIQELEQQIGQLQETLSPLQQELKQAEEAGGEDVQALQAELERLQGELAELEAGSQTAAEETASSELADENMASAAAAQEDHTAEIQEKRDQIAQLQGRIDAASAAEDRIASLKEQISQTQGELEAAEKQLDDQKTALANLKADYDRQTAQNRKNQGIQNQIDSLNNAGQSNAIQNAQAEVDQAKAALQEAKELLKTPVLTAKADGTVTEISYLPGDDVPAGKSIVTIGESSNQQVIVEISQEDIGSIEIGQQVEMRFPANPDEALTGTVKEKSLLPTQGGDGVTYKVTVVFDENHPELLKGMTCNVKFILRRVENVLILANKAITIQDGKQFVTVQLPDGSQEKREIKTGFSDGRVTEITAGLASGDIAVVAG